MLMLGLTPALSGPGERMRACGPLKRAVARSIVGKVNGWSVEAGSPAGAAIGGALEVAVDNYLVSL